MITLKERFLAPFKGIKPDHPAWLADISYWYRAMLKDGKVEEKYIGQAGLKRLHEDLGICCYYCFTGSTYSTEFDKVNIDVWEKDGYRQRTWETPKGTLSETWEYMPQSYCWAHTEYAVKNCDDLEILQDYYKRIQYHDSHEKFRNVAKFIGESGVPISPVPRSPLPALMTDWCGVEATIFLIMDHEKAVKKTLEVIDESSNEAFYIAKESNAELFHFCDNLDSANSSPYFNDYMKEYYEKRLEQLHKKNKFAVVHLDGLVKGLLPKLAEAGFDGVEALTPAPVGDVRIEDYADLVNNNRTVLWGGVPGAMFCHPWDKQQIIDITKNVLKKWERNGKLVVGTADQIPPDGDISFCADISKIILT
jgi:uroporphyrinogen decarboxylase-like protein